MNAPPIQTRPKAPLAAEDRVAVLLALYNGAAMVQDQLASIAFQSHRNWALIVSDDGSSDDGPARVRAFARADPAHDVTLVAGPRAGFAANFLWLLRAAGPSVPFAALSDQDDVWLPEKLARALAALARVPPGRPALYGGRTTICDADLRPLRPSPLFRRPPGFGNALVQSIAGGNTMVLNRAALDLAQAASRRTGHITAHDWWLYQLVSGAGGTVIYDPEPMTLYRQHGRNAIGAGDTLAASATRIWQVLNGRFRGWNEANLSALAAARPWLTPSAQEQLAAFARARTGPLRARLRALRRSGASRQTRRGHAALYLAAALGRL